MAFWNSEDQEAFSDRSLPYFPDAEAQNLDNRSKVESWMKKSKHLLEEDKGNDRPAKRIRKSSKQDVLSGQATRSNTYLPDSEAGPASFVPLNAPSYQHRGIPANRIQAENHVSSVEGGLGDLQGFVTDGKWFTPYPSPNTPKPFGEVNRPASNPRVLHPYISPSYQNSKTWEGPYVKSKSDRGVDSIACIPEMVSTSSFPVAGRFSSPSIESYSLLAADCVQNDNDKAISRFNALVNIPPSASLQKPQNHKAASRFASLVNSSPLTSLQQSRTTFTTRQQPVDLSNTTAIMTSPVEAFDDQQSLKSTSSPGISPCRPTSSRLDALGNSSTSTSLQRLRTTFTTTQHSADLSNTAVAMPALNETFDDQPLKSTAISPCRPTSSTPVTPQAQIRANAVPTNLLPAFGNARYSTPWGDQPYDDQNHPDVLEFVRDLVDEREATPSWDEDSVALYPTALPLENHPGLGIDIGSIGIEDNHWSQRPLASHSYNNRPGNHLASPFDAKLFTSGESLSNIQSSGHEDDNNRQSQPIPTHNSIIPNTTGNNTMAQSNSNSNGSGQPLSLKATLDALFPHREQMAYPPAPAPPTGWETSTGSHRVTIPAPAGPDPRPAFERPFLPRRGNINDPHLRAQVGHYNQWATQLTRAPEIRHASEALQESLGTRNNSVIIPALPGTAQRAMLSGSITNLRGLREMLLLHGNTGNQTKVELKDITFYDHTPLTQQVNVRDAVHTNQLVVNFGGSEMTVSGETVDVGKGGSGIGQRCVMYEVDIPKTPGSSETQRWIWFLIQRPILSMQDIPDDTANPLPSSLQPIPTYQPPPCPSNLPPGFFTIANTSSWMVIAAPLHSIQDMGTSKSPVYWDLPLASHSSVEGKKREFQLSFGGVPGFEFSDKEPIWNKMREAGVEGVTGEWLAATGVPAFVRTQADIDLDPHNEQLSSWFRELRRLQEVDAKRWGHVREMMARGSCRVVVRYEEEKEGPRRMRKGMRDGKGVGGLRRAAGVGAGAGGSGGAGGT